MLYPNRCVFMMSDAPRQVTASGRPDLSNCEVCGATIEPDPPDGFTEYARLVAGYIDHFSEEHPDHDLLDAPEAHL